MQPTTLLDLLALAIDRGASDLHFADGLPPVYRIKGELLQKSDVSPLTPEDVESLILPHLPESMRTGLLSGGLSDISTSLMYPRFPNREFSINVFRHRGGLAAAIRMVMQHIPALEQIGNMSGGDGDTTFLTGLSELRRGLVLMTGPTGSGKMTTAAAIIEHINQSRAERIFVLEETPGYTFTNKQSVVSTLRIGTDYESYERAASVVRTADPDIVVFSDLPSMEAARQALVLADTGHLVIAVVGSESAPQTLIDLVAGFPEPRDMVRTLLARTLAAVTNQRLLVRPSGQGRVAAYEWLRATPEIRELILRGAPVAEFMAAMDADPQNHRSLDAALDFLARAELITPEQAAANRRAA